jgi:hypothetical protein
MPAGHLPAWRWGNLIFMCTEYVLIATIVADPSQADVTIIKRKV